jgi:glutamate-1-semialdehyde 2,1-aminomutase
VLVQQTSIYLLSDNSWTVSWGVNRGLLLPPGLDEPWLISVAHTEADLASALEVLTGFLDAVAEVNLSP